MKKSAQPNNHSFVSSSIFLSFCPVTRSSKDFRSAFVRLVSYSTTITTTIFSNNDGSILDKVSRISVLRFSSMVSNVSSNIS